MIGRRQYGRGDRRGSGWEPEAAEDLSDCIRRIDRAKYPHAPASPRQDITWTVPHGRATFPANVPGVPFHHWAAAIAEATSIAHKGTVAGAKVMAGFFIDLLTKPELLTKAKETFRTEVAGSTYRSLLPPDQKPPVDLNAEEMAKYRDQMKVHYLRADINFK